MPRSYTNLLYHVAFGTKNRQPWLMPDIRARVHEYLGGIVRGAGGIALAIGGTDEHVHLLIKMRANESVADVVRTIKANSSRWIHDTFGGLREFGWQDGYGAFTVSQSQVEALRRYIAQQEEHHRRYSFVDELIQLFQAHEIEFDEKYLPM